MSFTTFDPATPRLHRSALAVPGSNPRFLEKAPGTGADVVFLDLEDSVAPDEKEKARAGVIEALQGLDWGRKSVALRINGLDTHYMYRDVVEVVERCPRLDLLVIPKVGVPADVYTVDVLLTQIEQATGRGKRVGLEVTIESALGLANAEAIARSSRRLEAMSFGAADFAASTHARSPVIGGLHPEYGVLGRRAGARGFHPADQWHYAQARIATACRAHGLRPIDGPYGDIGDRDGFIDAAKRAAILGFEGKWVIHPSQIDDANTVFSPTEEEVAHARRVLDAMREAQRQGKGAATLDGRMVDIVSIRLAENVLHKARSITGEKP